MKAIFISYNQALTDRVHNIMDDLNVKGFTKWDLTTGRGTHGGEPHMGTHAWPSMNSSIMAIVEDEETAAILAALKALNDSRPQQGIRAFVWEACEGM